VVDTDNHAVFLPPREASAREPHRSKAKVVHRFGALHIVRLDVRRICPKPIASRHQAS
jgi:hypothetical protein